jgi:hypothetical protein
LSRTNPSLRTAELALVKDEPVLTTVGLALIKDYPAGNDVSGPPHQDLAGLGAGRIEVDLPQSVLSPAKSSWS